jgi:hypothetical protein
MSSEENKTMASNNDVKSSQTDDSENSKKLPRSETEASLRRTGVVSEDVRLYIVAYIVAEASFSKIDLIFLS